MLKIKWRHFILHQCYKNTRMRSYLRAVVVPQLVQCGLNLSSMRFQLCGLWLQLFDMSPVCDKKTGCQNWEQFATFTDVNAGVLAFIMVRNTERGHAWSRTRFLFVSQIATPCNVQRCGKHYCLALRCNFCLRHSSVQGTLQTRDWQENTLALQPRACEGRMCREEEEICLWMFAQLCLFW